MAFSHSSTKIYLVPAMCIISLSESRVVCAVLELCRLLGTRNKKWAFEVFCGNFHDENIQCQEEDDLDSWDQEEFSGISAIHQMMKA